MLLDCRREFLEGARGVFERPSGCFGPSRAVEVRGSPGSPPRSALRAGEEVAPDRLRPEDAGLRQETRPEAAVTKGKSGPFRERKPKEVRGAARSSSRMGSMKLQRPGR